MAMVVVDCVVRMMVDVVVLGVIGVVVDFAVENGVVV